MSNLVPRQYREVAVATVDFPLAEATLRAYLSGREVYRRTRYVVFRRGTDTAVVEVSRAPTDQPMAVVTGVSVLALPPGCAYVADGDIDTGVPSELAAAAATHAPKARTVVVEGRYHHVNFIHDPAPVVVQVVDVAPPSPPKLFDQAGRVLATAEDLPAIRLVPTVVDLRALARSRPAATYLLPCRGSGFVLSGPGQGSGVAGDSVAGDSVAGDSVAGGSVAVAFLDERPPRREWTLIGCSRSRELHRWFYGDLPECIDMCPRRLAAGGDGGDRGDGAARAVDPAGSAGPAVTLTKCCLLEDRIEHDATTVVVPWGASLEQVRRGLRAAADLARQPAGGDAARDRDLDPQEAAWSPV